MLKGDIMSLIIIKTIIFQDISFPSKNEKYYLCVSTNNGPTSVDSGLQHKHMEAILNFYL